MAVLGAEGPCRRVDPTGGTAAAAGRGAPSARGALRPALEAAALVAGRALGAWRAAGQAEKRRPLGRLWSAARTAPRSAPPSFAGVYGPAATSTQTRWWSLPSAMAAEASLEAGQNTPLSR